MLSVESIHNNHPVWLQTLVITFLIHNEHWTLTALSCCYSHQHNWTRLRTGGNSESFEHIALLYMPVLSTYILQNNNNKDIFIKYQQYGILGGDGADKVVNENIFQILQLLAHDACKCVVFCLHIILCRQLLLTNEIFWWVWRYASLFKHHKTALFTLCTMQR